MERVLESIFDKIVFEGSLYNELGMKLDEEVDQAIAPYVDSLEEDETEKLKAMIYKVSYTAEKQGFYLGMHTLLEILYESLKSSGI